MRNLHVWAEAHAHVLLPTSHYSINVNWFYFCKLDIVKIDRYDEKDSDDEHSEIEDLLWHSSPCV